MLTITDDDDQEWVALGFDAATGDHLWVPADTRVLRSPLFDYPAVDEPEQLQLPGPEDAA
jgi:hypothetical protein